MPLTHSKATRDGATTVHGRDEPLRDAYDDVWELPERYEPIGSPRSNRWIATATVLLVLAFVVSLINAPGSLLDGPISGSAASLGIDSDSSTDLSNAAWSCGPIGYRIVREGAPEGAAAFVDDAASRLEAASGSTITLTRDPDVESWANDDPGYNGITIGWAPDAVAGWEGDAVGVGGGTLFGTTIVEGDAWLRPDIDELAYSAAFDAAGPILLHELGHAVGLGHERQSAESLMTPRYNGITDFTEIDRQALQRKGVQACAQ